MKLIFPKRPAVKVEDVFSTTLYTGNGTTQDITTGIDLVNHAGLVWIKNRDAADSHVLTDTIRGAGKVLSSDATTVETTDADTTTAFGDGVFSIGADVKVNTNTETYASWTFRKARRFFDVATVTKTSGANTTVDFSSLATLGMVTVKLTNDVGGWFIWHKNLSDGKLMRLDTTAVETTLANITVSGTTVTLVDGLMVDGDYVLYAWAHDINARGIIQCGSYTGNGLSTGPEIDLGWRPQWLMVKNKDSLISWTIWDNARSPTNPRQDVFWADRTDDEQSSTVYAIDFLTTGFQPKTSSSQNNTSGDTYIYLAIREE